jgi:hypothetical protein
MAVDNKMVAVGLTVAVLIFSIIAIASPALKGSVSVASWGGAVAGLSVTAFLLAIAAFGCAAAAHSKGERKGWLAAFVLTAIVWLFEMCAFASFADPWVQTFGGGGGYAFIILTWLLTFPTLFFLFKAYQEAPGQAPPAMAGQAPPPPPPPPMAQAEMVRTEIPVAQGVATV